MFHVKYPITPCPAPRQVRSDAWNPSPSVQRYRAFRDECRLRRVQVPESGVHITFRMPMPASWSKRKAAELDGQPHQQKPDVDNLVKALLDSVYGDDCAVWQISAEKRWARQGAIEVRSESQ